MSQYKDPAPFNEQQRPFIPLNPVESNQVGAIGYDPESQTLAVQFKRGARAIYHYTPFDQESFDKFAAAESKGAFFKSHVSHLAFEKYPNEDKPEPESAPANESGEA